MAEMTPKVPSFQGSKLYRKRQTLLHVLVAKSQVAYINLSDACTFPDCEVVEQPTNDDIKTMWSGSSKEVIPVQIFGLFSPSNYMFTYILPSSKESFIFLFPLSGRWLAYNRCSIKVY